MEVGCLLRASCVGALVAVVDGLLAVQTAPQMVFPHLVHLCERFWDRCLPILAEVG